MANWEQYIIAISAGQGVFLTSVFLLISSGDKRVNRFMAALLVLLTLYQFDLFLTTTDFFHNHPHFLFLTVPFWYLFPPLAYSIVRILFNKNYKFKSIHLLTLIPFLIILFRLIPFYMLSAEHKLEYWTGARAIPGSEIVNYLYSLLAPVPEAGYYLAAVIFLFPLKPNTKKLRFRLNWFKLVFLLMFLHAIYRVVNISCYFLLNLEVGPSTKVTLVIHSILFYLIAYAIVLKPHVIFTSRIVQLNRKNKIVFSNSLIEEIKDLMNSKKLFLNPNLRYSDLASELDISVRTLSSAFSQQMGVTFQDFVNSYRIEEVKKRISNGEISTFTLFGIAFESGFKSRSTFNRAFKKIYGSSPSEYLQSIKSSR